jgi:hypothetical protein
VRLRHTLAEHRLDWHQRIQAQLYHHGVPRRRELPMRDNRAWLEGFSLSEAARLHGPLLGARHHGSTLLCVLGTTKPAAPGAALSFSVWLSIR